MFKPILNAVLTAALMAAPLLARAHDDRGYDEPYDRGRGVASRPYAGVVTAELGRMAQIEIVDRGSGRALPIYRHHNDWYVAGEPGRSYSIRVRSDVGRPLVAVASVDGVNVISGQTAGYDQIGYALTPHDGLRIDGWRKSYQQVARFKFANGSRAYATRTGRPDHLGVIGIALFRNDPRYDGDRHDERYDDRYDGRYDGYGDDGRRAPYAKSYRGAPQPQFGTAHGSLARSPTDAHDYAYARGRPDEVIRIHYDSRQNLVARGIIPPQERGDGRYGPNPFPVSARDGFVPNPW